MWMLALACAFFLAIHLMISATALKDRVIGRIGGTAYYILFALLSLGGLIWMGIAFGMALDDSMNVVLWSSGTFLRVIGILGNFLAFLLVVIGYTSPSPTNMVALWRMPDHPVTGIIRITRHPVLAGIGLWALTHMVCNGNLAAWIFFGSLLALCALGANTIDRKRALLMGEVYEKIKRRTSIVPFVAMLEGRVAFDAKEIGIVRPLLATSMFSVFLVLHELIFTVRAI
ncbi:MAG TPA: NnrU family protein [Asticcacaulis sp.]|nr:NnrU family protein [Asticcacaulis sp.]